ncbi:hypothetical protein [Bacillus sp. T3]|uniref:hypothetical protein n=1 Tax=Bacillus sp. T3 TaxID=467262 RepID=UPI0029819A13|nr:hypothetical protein [Bacillus sp. T3]
MRWVVTIVMIFHGLIHIMGGVNELGLSKIEELSVGTLIVLPNLLQRMLGIVWFAAVALFLVSAIGLIMKRNWWKKIAISAVIVSQLLIILWWPSAKFGSIANVIILIGLINIKGTSDFGVNTGIKNIETLYEK